MELQGGKALHVSFAAQASVARESIADAIAGHYVSAHYFAESGCGVVMTDEWLIVGPEPEGDGLVVRRVIDDRPEGDKIVVEWRRIDRLHVR